MRNLKITLGALLLTMTFNFSMAQSVAEKATSQTESMNELLELSSDQKARISELNFGILDKNDAITKDQNMSAEVKKQSIEGNNEARLEILRGILTPEQMEIYKKSESNVKRSASTTVQMSNIKIAPATAVPAE